MKSRSLVYAFVVLLFSSISCKQRVEEQKREPLNVEIMVADSVLGDLTHTYVGEVEENVSVSLSFPMGGKVERVYVHEGDRVRAGQLIATINSENAKNAYNSAKASLQQAEDAYKRLKKVYDSGSLAEVKWVEMETTLEKARSMEQIARKQLEECSLTAPVSGIVGNCNAKAGGSILPGEPAATILDVDKLSVAFSVPESEISSVEIGDDAFVYVAALNNKMLNGKISEKSVISSKISHSYRVKVDLPFNDKEMIPGMVCKVLLEHPDRPGFVIPAKCVQTRPEGLSVWVVKNGKAYRRLITSYEFTANGVLANSGINDGDTIVTAGMQKLYSGANCSISNR